MIDFFSLIPVNSQADLIAGYKDAIIRRDLRSTITDAEIIQDFNERMQKNIERWMKVADPKASLDGGK